MLRMCNIVFVEYLRETDNITNKEITFVKCRTIYKFYSKIYEFFMKLLELNRNFTMYTRQKFKICRYGIGYAF